MARPTSRAPRRPTAPRSAPTRSRRRARSWAGTIRRSRSPPTIVAAWRAAGARGAGAHARLARPARRERAARPSSAAAWPGALPRRLLARADYLAGLIAEPAEGRDPQGVGAGARGDQRRSCPRRSAARPTSPARTTPKPRRSKPLTTDDYSGRYIYYGIREFGMAAAMNGMALHGGVIPYGGTFLIFSDYARPAIRLSALQQVRGRLCDDPRFDRPRRGRADPPADRASA